MKIGIYMGSFNPVHKAHIKIMNHLLNKHYVDKILVVPTLNYWNKQNLAPIKDRINMLKFYENDKILIDTKHNKYIYTYELYQELQKEYPNDELVLIMGADNLLCFDKWKNYKELLKLNFLVLKRNNIDTKYILKKYPKNHFIIINDFDEVNISASTIRNNLNNDNLDIKVFNYIKENNLYEGGNNE